MMQSVERPSRYQSKISGTSWDIFERSEDFIHHTREKRLILKKEAMSIKERREMENCSFKPKINDESYLKRRRVKRLSKSMQKRRDTSKSCPTTPNRLTREPFTKRIGSKEFLEFELMEEEEQQVFPTFNEVNGGDKCKQSSTKPAQQTNKFQNRHINTPQKQAPKSQNTSMLEFKTPLRNKSSQQLKSSNNRSQRFKAQISNSRSQRNFDYKRSIVVLNENDEFEDINVYIAKMKNQIKKKSQQELQKQKNMIKKGLANYQNDYFDVEVEFDMVEFGSSVNKVNGVQQEKPVDGRDEMDKENQSNGNNCISNRYQFKNGGQLGNKVKVTMDQDVDGYNTEIISEKIEKLIKKNHPISKIEKEEKATINSKKNQPTTTPAQIYQSINKSKHKYTNQSPISQKRRSNHPPEKFDQIKQKILMVKQEQNELREETHLRKSVSWTRAIKSNLSQTDEDLLEDLQSLSKNTQYVNIKTEKQKPVDDFFKPLKFASNNNKNSKKIKMENVGKRKDFLVINGEKIYFEQSTIQSILNVDRVSRLSNFKNTHFGGV